MTICWICSRHLAPSKGREMRLVEDMAVLRTWVCYECRPVEDEGEDRMSHYMLTADSIFVEESDARLDYGRSWESEETDKECRKYAQELSDDKWTYEYRDVIVIRSIIRYKTEYKVKYIQKGEKIPKNLIKIVGVLQFIRDAIDIDTMHDDPLPPHEPDGYWSGYRVDDMWVREGTKSSDYAEDDDIPAMAQKYAVYPIRVKHKNGDGLEITDEDRLSRYIRNVALYDLITNDGDNRIRYVLLDSHHDRTADVVGMLVCRCGDCGKKAQGIFRGNPNMGDHYYQIMHRKDWFCSNFKWTFMGGHGYSGGRRMICPECSVRYQQEQKKMEEKK